MASSVVDICNQALYLLGASTITAIDEGTTLANLCNLLWPEVRDTVFRDHPWNCLITRAELAQDSTDPEYGYDNSFQLPADPLCLRVLSTDQDEYVDADGQYYYPYAIEGRFIFTDALTLKIKYVGRVTDVTKYDSLLVSALAAKLAAELAYPVTKSHQVVESMRARYEKILNDAKLVDAQEGSPEVFESNVLWNARL